MVSLDTVTPTRTIVLGLVRGADFHDAIVEGDELLLVRLGRRPSARGSLAGPTLLLLGWAAAVYAKIGLRRMPFLSSDGLTEYDDSLARRRLRVKDLPLRDLLALPGTFRVLTAGLHVRVIEGGDSPMVELSRGTLREPIVLEAAGDPPQRLVRLLVERGAIAD